MLWGGYCFRYGFSEKVAFGQRLDFERTSSSNIRWGKHMTGRENSMCKGSEVRAQVSLQEMSRSVQLE